MLIASVKAAKLEGLVAKNARSRYEPGVRSGAWQKMRINVGQAFVIGGYTVGGTTFDALVFEYYEGTKLYAARTRNGLRPRFGKPIQNLSTSSQLARDDQREFEWIDRLRYMDLITGTQRSDAVFGSRVGCQGHRGSPGVPLPFPTSESSNEIVAVCARHTDV